MFGFHHSPQLCDPYNGLYCFAFSEPENIADQFRTAFQNIADNRGHWNVKKLAGREGYWLRIGGYRGIYKIEGEQVTVIMLDIGPREGRIDDYRATASVLEVNIDDLV